MIRFGIFRFDNKDTFAIIGSILAIIALFKYPILLSTVALFCGILSKYTKSKYWSSVIFVSLGGYIVYLIDAFWL